MNAQLSPSPDPDPAVSAAAESLTAPQWCELLGKAPQVFRRRCPVSRSEVIDVGGGRIAARQVFAFGDLPADYRAVLETRRETQGAANCAALLEMQRVETRRWDAPRAWLDNKPTVRVRAEQRHAMMAVWYAALNAGATKTEANRRARTEFYRITGKPINEKQVRRIAAEIDGRGGELAPLEAYCDGKQSPHLKARLHVPEEFLTAVKSKVLEPGVRLMSAAVRFYEIAWSNGQTVPGLGRAQPGEPFPYRAAQLRRFMPGMAAREQAGRGKFAAKTAGLLPALPVGSRTLRLRERIVFDDKRLDFAAKDDLTGNPVTLTLYLAMDEATRQILGYLLREDGGVRQTDVEGLTAFILRVCGMAGTSAGYATTLKFELGTVAISAARQRLLEMLYPGQIVISRTKIIGGHNVPGDFSQSNAGNFFGKGKLESFMATLDRYTAHIAGQRGNVYRNQPLMLGDLFTTGESIVNGARKAGFRLKGTMIEEAVLCANTAQALHFHQTGALPGAFAASQATGVKGPLLFVSEVHLAVQAVIAYYNAERGHRREGFLEMPMVTPEGGLRQVRESSNDKAARLERELAAQGRSLSRISEADAAVLLHKVRRVTVKPNGALVSIGKVKRLYWHEHSLAIDAAQRSTLGEKEYLALYNPEDPRELYLLHNPVGQVPATADELPAGTEPHFFEALPLHEVPEITDPAAMAEQSRRVAANHGKVSVEIARNIVPFLAEQAERRGENLRLTHDLAEPLRAAVTVLRDEGAKSELPASALAAEIAAHRAGEQAPTRLSARPAAESDLARFQREHAAAPVAPSDTEPEIV